MLAVTPGRSALVGLGMDPELIADALIRAGARRGVLSRLDRQTRRALTKLDGVLAGCNHAAQVPSGYCFALSNPTRDTHSEVREASNRVHGFADAWFLNAVLGCCCLGDAAMEMSFQEEERHDRRAWEAAETWVRVSMQSASSSTIRAMPLTCPSTRRRRLAKAMRWARDPSACSVAGLPEIGSSRVSVLVAGM